MIKRLVITGKDLEVSDSYHTMSELYTHRVMLFVALMKCNKDLSWKSRLHNDGTSFDGWFIAGMNLPSGNITYHIPDTFWDMIEDINTVEKSPPWDGHTGDDVIKRLNSWCVGI
jgi:hypothetical protein